MHAHVGEAHRVALIGGQQVVDAEARSEVGRVLDIERKQIVDAGDVIDTESGVDCQPRDWTPRILKIDCVIGEVALSQEPAASVVDDLFEASHAGRRIVDVAEHEVLFGQAAVGVLDRVEPVHARLEEHAELELV